MTFELQDVFSRSFLGGTLSINGQNYAVPAIFNNVRNGTTFNVGASAPGYWVVPPKPVTAMAVGSAPIGAPLQYLTSIIPVPTTVHILYYFLKYLYTGFRPHDGCLSKCLSPKSPC